MIITDAGVMIRFHAKDVSQTGRATLGVRLIRLDDGSKVSTMAVVEPVNENDNTEKIAVETEQTDEELKANMQDFAEEIFKESEEE